MEKEDSTMKEKRFEMHRLAAFSSRYPNQVSEEFYIFLPVTGTESWTVTVLCSQAKSGTGWIRTRSGLIGYVLHVCASFLNLQMAECSNSVVDGSAAPYSQSPPILSGW